jgi:hypothetical protein
MCLRRAPEKYIAGAALDRAAIHFILCVFFSSCDVAVIVSTVL